MLDRLGEYALDFVESYTAAELIEIYLSACVIALAVGYDLAFLLKH